MSNTIKKLEQSICPHRMAESIREFPAADEDYATDRKDLAGLEALPLEYLSRLIANDYIACLRSSIDRTAELAYLAGFRDALQNREHHS